MEIPLVNVLVFEHVRARKTPSSDLKAVTLFAALTLTLVIWYGATRIWSNPVSPNAQALKVGLVQGNVSLYEFWNDKHKKDIVHRHLALADEVVRSGAELVVWPETSFPHFIWEEPELYAEMRAFSADKHVPLLFGAVTREANEGREEYFNSVFYLKADGAEGGTYSKTHLVLFGEYIPFRKELPFLVDIVGIDDFTPGRSTAVFELGPDRKVAPLICFEDTIPAIARAAVRKGAGLLVNMTNDAWFKDSPGPVMHLHNAMFRTVENRRTLVRATNTGLSCVIDSYGRLSACVEDSAGRRLLTPGVLTKDVAFSDAETFYTKYGDVFALLCFAGILLAIVAERVGAGRDRPVQTKDAKRNFHV